MTAPYTAIYSSVGNLDFLDSSFSDEMTTCDQYANVPDELRGKSNWLVWKLIPNEDPTKKPRKVPFNPRTGGLASSTNPTDWTTLGEALAAVNGGSYTGVGFVFDGTGIVGVDLDNVRDPATGTVEPWAEDEINYFGSYTEVSPSGTGFHILCRSDLQHIGVNNGQVEIYSSGRFFTVTGNLYDEGLNTLEDCSEQHRRLYTEYAPKNKQTDAQPAATCDRSVMTAEDKTLCDRIGASKQGEKFTDLFTGQWSEKYPSQSEADMAMLFMLAFWTGKDSKQMDRIFRSSRLHRDKWDSMRGDTTYGQICLGRAISGTGDAIGSKSPTHYSAEDLSPAPPAAKVNKFQFVPAASLQCNTQIEWQIEGVMEYCAFSLMFGDSGTMKSFVALDMGLCIATGIDYHGRKVRQGPVVIIIGEGLAGYGRRIAAWSKYHGIDLTDHPVFVSTMAAQFLDDNSAGEVEEAVNAISMKYGEVRLVIVDTLNRNFGPGDESSTADMTKFIGALDMRLGNRVTKMIVHHTGHGDKTRARGAYALKAALDCEIQISRLLGKIVLTNTKQKDAPEFSPITFDSQVVDLDHEGEIDLLDPMTSLVLTENDETPHEKHPSLSPKMGMALSLLDLMNRKSGPTCLSHWMHMCGEEKVYSKSPFYTATKTMEDKKVIVISNGYVMRS